MDQLNPKFNLAWVVIGDLNAYLYPWDKDGGIEAVPRQLMDLNEFMGRNLLLDLGYRNV